MEDKIEELQGNIATMELAIESLQEAIYYMSELDESMADFWQDDVDDLKRRIEIGVLRSRTGFRCGILKINEPDGISGLCIRITDDIGYRARVYSPLTVLPVRLRNGQRP